LKDRRDGFAVAVGKQQSGLQFIAEILRIGQGDAVVFAGVVVVVKLRPIVDNEGKVVTGVGDGSSGSLEQRLGKCGSRDTLVAPETPGGLGSGKGIGSIRERTDSGRGRLQWLEMPQNQILVAGLETFFYIRQMRYILPLYTLNIQLCRY